MKDSTKGILVVGAALAVVAVGGIKGREFAPSTVPAIPAADAAAIDQFAASPQAQAHGLKPGAERLVDSVTQGDDAVDIVRMDAEDGDGPLTLYFFVENGKLAGVTYAQNGSAG